MKRGGKRDSFLEQMHRYRGVMLIVSTPLVLILIVILLMPRAVPGPMPHETASADNDARPDILNKEVEVQVAISAGSERFAVIIDCGSTGSRVHVYRFSEQLDLLDMNGKLELFVQKKPGLSSFHEDPRQGGESLRELLDQSIAAVPKELQSQTPVVVGATAGLRLLPGSKAEQLLEEVRKVLSMYPFTFKPDSVKILDGADEGSYAWVTVNYLLGNLGKGIDSTVGVVDLGGGSVQMTYAVSPTVLSTAPKGYVRTLTGKGTTYNIYVHSYLGFGLMAARAAVLKQAAGEDGHACLAKGLREVYKYGSEEFQAAAREVGGSFELCAQLAQAALELKTPCQLSACSFQGVWSGGGGAGFTKLYVASYFFDRAAQLGVIPDATAPLASVKASKFLEVGTNVCGLPLEELTTTYPLMDKKDAGYACLDVVYQYNLLTAGFGIDPDAVVTLVKRVVYNGKEVEAAWPLGAAIDALS